MRPLTSNGLWVVLPQGHPNGCNGPSDVRFREFATTHLRLYQYFSCEHTIKADLENCGYYKLFERFYFPVLDNATQQESLTKNFFNWLALAYESCITKKLNIKCYEFLMSLALTSRVAISDVLDFGCGTAAILESNIPKLAERIVGYDFSDSMVTLSEARGLHVLKASEFKRLQKGSFDVVFCSYVLHYGIATRQLDGLLSLLRPGGIFVGNVHKGIRQEILASYAINLPVELFSSAWCDSDFGPCISITRQI